MSSQHMQKEYNEGKIDTDTGIFHENVYKGKQLLNVYRPIIPGAIVAIDNVLRSTINKTHTQNILIFLWDALCLYLKCNSNKTEYSLS